MSSKKVSRKDAKTQSREEEPMSKKSKTLGVSASLREPENQDGKPALVPKLRFPEFRAAEGWEQKAIGQVCKSFSGGTPNTSQKEFYGGSIPFIRSAEIDRAETELFLTEDGLINSAAKRVAKGDVLVALYGANSGDVALGKIDGAINQAILCLKSESSNAFIYQFLSHKQSWIITTYLQGGQGNLSGDIVKSISLGFPTPAEQQRIAECLSSVDELMAAQSRKVDALKTHKKGLMQQLFPREGETQPRLRFPEFQNAGEWESGTLEDLCIAKISYGIVQAGPHVPNGMPYIKSMDLNSKLALPNLSRTSDVIAQKYRRSEVVPGDIVISLRGNTGVAQIVPKQISVSNLTQGTARLRTAGPPEFYLHALQSPSVHGRILVVAKGSTFQEISLEGLRKILLFFPKPAEQQRIASCLSSLDALITAETQKLEALKTHKKALMQQLFPSPEEIES